MSGPNSKPQIGQQNYRTPPAFLAAVRRRIGIESIDWDLACTTADCVGAAGGYTHPEVDALAEDWTVLARIPDVTCWVNPPFAQSGAFCAKAASSGARVIALVPVAIGTKWWKQHVHRRAVVLGTGRLTFDNPDGTPAPAPINRDCALLVYNILPEGTDYYLLEDWRLW